LLEKDCVYCKWVCFDTFVDMLTGWLYSSHSGCQRRLRWHRKDAFGTRCIRQSSRPGIDSLLLKLKIRTTFIHLGMVEVHNKYNATEEKRQTHEICITW